MKLSQLARFILSAIFTSDGLIAATPQTVSFNEHIQPIISENCYHCHGSDARSRKAELRLDREEFDLVAVGRALLQDPQWLLKVRDGRTEELMAFERTAFAALS